MARDFGSDFNPFDVHRRVVIAVEMLVERPQLTTQAVAAGIDLLVVDEAQHLRGDGSHLKRWEAALQAAIKAAAPTGDPVLGEGDLVQLSLLSAGLVQPDSLDWNRAAQQHFQNEWQARRKDAKTQSTMWPMFFPADAPAYQDLPPSTPQLFRAWTMARAKALPKHIVFIAAPASGLADDVANVQITFGVQNVRAASKNANGPTMPLLSVRPTTAQLVTWDGKTIPVTIGK